MSPEPNETVTLQPGAAHEVRLGGLGAAGYTWGARLDGDADVVEVAQASADAPSLPPAGGPPPSSSSTDFVFVISARQPGAVRVTFFLHRPWERDKPPLREVVVAVSVQP